MSRRVSRPADVDGSIRPKVRVLEARSAPNQIFALPAIAGVKLVACEDTSLAFRIPFLVPATIAELSSVTLFVNHLTSKRKAIAKKLIFPQAFPIAFSLDALGVVIEAPTWRRV